MRKTLNKERIEGLVYEHDLKIKKVQNTDSKNFGKDFISGTLDIATDDACENIVQVHFTYVTEVTAKGKKNDTYTALKNIIDNGKTIISDGASAATMVRIDTSIGVNDFYSDNAKTDKNPDGLVSAKRNEGGFVHIITKMNEEPSRNTFEVDMLINNTRFVEANDETGAEEYLILKGVIFDFKGAILPVEFSVRSGGGIKYFEGLDINKDNMVFTKVWGKIVSHQSKVTRTEQSAFGEDKVVEYTKTQKEWVVVGAANEPYELGDSQNGITVDELKKAVEDRNVYLADVKKRQEEYQASKNDNTVAPKASTGVSAAMGGFNF